MRGNSIGDTVTLTILRNGAEEQVDVVLGSDTSDSSQATSPYGIFGGQQAPGYGYGFNGADLLNGQPVASEMA